MGRVARGVSLQEVTDGLALDLGVDGGPFGQDVLFRALQHDASPANPGGHLNVDLI